MKVFFFVPILSLLLLGFKQDNLNKNKSFKNKDSSYVKNNISSYSDLEIPLTKDKNSIICHTGYCFLYDESNEQSRWVAYKMTKEKAITKAASRNNKFIPDPLVKTETADDKDYLKSGYDRGHLAPAADMTWSKKAMQESFYYSNISPQLPAFNRGIWKKLEELVRFWVIEYDELYIVTGPVLSDNLKKIGNNKVSVPLYFYKVILDYKLPEIKAIGFIIPNKGISKPLYNFAVSIDSVEKVTGIDFFYQLDDKEEEKIERNNCINCWIWKQ